MFLRARGGPNYLTQMLSYNFISVSRPLATTGRSHKGGIYNVFRGEEKGGGKFIHGGILKKGKITPVSLCVKFVGDESLVRF